MRHQAIQRTVEQIDNFSNYRISMITEVKGKFFFDVSCLEKNQYSFESYEEANEVRKEIFEVLRGKGFRTLHLTKTIEEEYLFPPEKVKKKKC